MPTKKRKKATEQGKSPISGTAPPVEYQFGQPHGNKRHNGSWKKEDTARYKLEQMIKLDYDDLVKIREDMSAPVFERRLAKSLLDEWDWKTTESMINQVYGRPQERVSVETKSDSSKELLDYLRKEAETHK